MNLPESLKTTAWPSTLVTLLALSGATGCAGPEDDQEAEGVPVTPGGATRGLPEAIGALGVIADVNGRGDSFTPQCTGVLIGPQTILTSVRNAFCLPTLEHPAGFAIGGNGRAPLRVLPVVDGDLAPIRATPRIADDDQMPSLAVVYLKDPVPDIAPLALGTLTVAQVDARFRSAGYAYERHQNTDLLDVIRESRVVTLRSLSGPYFPLIFAGHFRSFRKWWWGSIEPVEYPGLEPAIRAYYRGVGPDPFGAGGPAILDDGYEALVEKSQEDTSFGPLASNLLIRRNPSGVFVVYGVASAPLDSPDHHHDIYETFGPDTRTFLAGALSWKDPCATRRQAGGYCDGATARVCGADHKTQRSHNCAAFGVSCAITAEQPVCR